MMQMFTFDTSLQIGIHMFSGIIEQLGTVQKIKRIGEGTRLWIQSPLVVASAGEAGVGTTDRDRVGLGDSIAIFGVCLTVEEVHPPHTFVVVCGQETIRSTMLKSLRQGSQVHLERALKVGKLRETRRAQGRNRGQCATT